MRFPAAAPTCPPPPNCADGARAQWSVIETVRSVTELPVILKGIMTAEDAHEAADRKVDAIVLSNHGGHQLDGSPSGLEVALEIKDKDEAVFRDLAVFADSGVRYGADVLMLLSLGVRMVGVGRPFMYANVLGQPGVREAIRILKHELALDAGNLGVPDVGRVPADIVSQRRSRRRRRVSSPG